MTWLLPGAGIVLALVTLRDIFHTLWHPRGLGRISRLLFTWTWRTSNAFSARLNRSTELAGPLGLLATVAVWTTLIVLGWTLIYLPHMPQGFFFFAPLQPATSSDWLASVYLSMVAVATLGFGDIVPADPFLRLATPLQPMVGFILLTAAISWVLQIYPALAQRRTLAQRLAMLASTGADTVAASGEPSVAYQMLDAVARASPPRR